MPAIGLPHVLGHAVPVVDLPAGVGIGVGLGRAGGDRLAIEVLELRRELADDPRLALGRKRRQPEVGAHEGVPVTHRRPPSRRRSHDAVDGGDVRLPGLLLLGEDAPTLGCQTVEAAFALTGLLDPAAFDPAAVLEPEERGVERRAERTSACRLTAIR